MLIVGTKVGKMLTFVMLLMLKKSTNKVVIVVSPQHPCLEASYLQIEGQKLLKLAVPD